MKEENSSPHVGRVAVAHAEASSARETLRHEVATSMAERMAVLEEVFRTSPSFLHVLRGPDFVFELVNDAYYQLVGHRDLIGRAAFEALPEAALGGYQERIARVLETGEPFYGHELPVTLARTPGAPSEARIIDLIYLPLRDADGTCTRVLGHGTDVTERVWERERAERALRENEAQRAEAALLQQAAEARESALREREAWFRLIADAVPQIVWITDAEGRVEFFNQQWTAYTGLDYRPDSAAEVAATVVHPEDAAITMERFEEARRTGTTFQVEHRIRSRSGDYRWFLVRGEPIRDPSSGEIRHWFGASLDIHDRKLAEAALRESEARYRTLFESMDEGVCVIEVLFDAADQPVDYRFLEVNPAFAGHTGIKDGVGRTMLEIAPDHESHWFEIYGRVACTGEPVRFERPAEALGRFYDVYAFRVGDPEQRRVAVLFNDISERVKATQALQEADRRKDEFLATLAHELRNPLAPLVTAMEVLRLRADDPAAVERARDTIGRQVEHMRRLIDDLLDVARITRGMVDLHLETVDLASVLADAVQMARPRIDRRRQQLTVLVPLEAVRLEGDPHRLIQVITNLLTNAAKFTPQGGEITVTAERSGAEAVVRVRDTGKGIPAEMLPHVFDLFTQVNPSIDRGEGGLGLGLTLVQKLVQMHGGQVEAYSAGTGLGSEFSVRLPIHPVEPRPDGPAASTTAAVDVERRLRVLVVDDNVDAADTLADLLPIWGHEVRVAYTGPEAVAAARNWLPHVILLDIGLPGMDGYAVARQIQEAPALAAVRLVALTGFGQAEDRQRSHDAGFDAHLTKPVDLDELRNVLEAQPPRALMHS